MVNSGLCYKYGCPTGTYTSTDEGPHICKYCGAGHYCSHGVSRACPSGQYASGTGSATCSSCPSGQYGQETGMSQCTVCPSGHFSEGVGKTAPCIPCPSGHYASGTGSGTCAQCPGGYYYGGVGATSCTPCPAGYFCGTGATATTECGTGHYCPAKSSKATLCPACSNALPRRTTPATTATDISGCTCAPPPHSTMPSTGGGYHVQGGGGKVKSGQSAATAAHTAAAVAGATPQSVAAAAASAGHGSAAAQAAAAAANKPNATPKSVAAAAAAAEYTLWTTGCTQMSGKPYQPGMTQCFQLAQAEKSWLNEGVCDPSNGGPCDLWLVGQASGDGGAYATTVIPWGAVPASPLMIAAAFSNSTSTAAFGVNCPQRPPGIAGPTWDEATGLWDCKHTTGAHAGTPAPCPPSCGMGEVFEGAAWQGDVKRSPQEFHGTIAAQSGWGGVLADYNSRWNWSGYFTDVSPYEMQMSGTHLWTENTCNPDNSNETCPGMEGLMAGSFGLNYGGLYSLQSGGQAVDLSNPTTQSSHATGVNNGDQANQTYNSMMIGVRVNGITPQLHTQDVTVADASNVFQTELANLMNLGPDNSSGDKMHAFIPGPSLSNEGDSPVKVKICKPTSQEQGVGLWYGPAAPAAAPPAGYGNIGAGSSSGLTGNTGLVGGASPCNNDAHNSFSCSECSSDGEQPAQWSWMSPAYPQIAIIKRKYILGDCTNIHGGVTGQTGVTPWECQLDSYPSYDSKTQKWVGRVRGTPAAAAAPFFAPRFGGGGNEAVVSGSEGFTNIVTSSDLNVDASLIASPSYTATIGGARQYSAGDVCSNHPARAGLTTTKCGVPKPPPTWTRDCPGWPCGKNQGPGGKMTAYCNPNAGLTCMNNNGDGVDETVGTGVCYLVQNEPCGPDYSISYTGTCYPSSDGFPPTEVRGTSVCGTQGKCVQGANGKYQCQGRVAEIGGTCDAGTYCLGGSTCHIGSFAGNTGMRCRMGVDLGNECATGAPHGASGSYCLTPDAKCLSVEGGYYCAKSYSIGQTCAGGPGQPEAEVNEGTGMRSHQCPTGAACQWPTGNADAMGKGLKFCQWTSGGGSCKGGDNNCSSFFGMECMDEAREPVATGAPGTCEVLYDCSEKAIAAAPPGMCPKTCPYAWGGAYDVSGSGPHCCANPPYWVNAGGWPVRRETSCVYMGSDGNEATGAPPLTPEMCIPGSGGVNTCRNPCAGNSYATDVWSNTCYDYGTYAPCPMNHYAGTKGACNQCPNGRVTVKTGATNVSDCYCPTGHYGPNGASDCKSCSSLGLAGTGAVAPNNTIAASCGRTPAEKAAAGAAAGNAVSGVMANATGKSNLCPQPDGSPSIYKIWKEVPGEWDPTFVACGNKTTTNYHPWKPFMGPNNWQQPNEDDGQNHALLWMTDQESYPPYYSTSAGKAGDITPWFACGGRAAAGSSSMAPQYGKGCALYSHPLVEEKVIIPCSQAPAIKAMGGAGSTISPTC